MPRLYVIMLVLFGTSFALAAEPHFRLAPLFTDNMVLQQERKVPIWGRGTPGDTIAVRASWGEQAMTLVGADSGWSLDLKTPAAGGPARIEICHDQTTLTLSNVLIGEVWLCSGQSNMEMPLEGWPPNDTIANSGMEISGSFYFPTVRFFTVKRSFSPVPESTCEGTWSECSPATSPAFSATAYFFGKALQQALNVPVGLIHSSWGGTPVEAWTSRERLSSIAGFDSVLRKINSSVDSLRLLKTWLSAFPTIDVRHRESAMRWHDLSFNDSACARRSFSDSIWHDMTLPVLWELTELGQFDGTVWFRRQVVIPAAWVHRDLLLDLGPIDDIDIAYVNGVKVGSHEEEGMWNVDRSYRIPGSLVDSVVMQLAVRVIDYQGGGGIYGQEKALALRPGNGGERVSLAGAWKYLPVAEFREGRFFVFGAEGQLWSTRPHMPLDLSGYSPTVLYNGMITPLAPYAIRGAIWYQGEANTGNPALYRTLFPLMIEDWRSTFRIDNLPFYYVQIAPFEYGPRTRSEFLREAQLLTLGLPNTGMAVTLDIGNPKNIHPANKEDVGKRLALWALAKTYNKKVEFSGPIYKSMKKKRNSIELSFEYVGKGLVLKSSEQGNGFLIAGADSVFKDARVKVKGNRLIVSHPEIVDPQAVRYAFSNSAGATLFNKAGLPSPSFRTDSW
jgi:sialate O-acetylesterase